VVIGPGLGRDAARADLLAESLAAARTAVLDADALTVLADTPDLLRSLVPGRTIVLTPHRGEFRTLFPDLAETAADDPWAAAERAAESTGCTVLLKGVPTVIAVPGRAPLTVAAGNPGLATGGSGDTLSGVIGALLARGMPGDEAAAVAALALGEAADQAATEHGVRSLRPMHVVAALEAVWRAWAEESLAPTPWLAELLPPELG
jgi:NAD(P)H-hydrate epimerase